MNAEKSLGGQEPGGNVSAVNRHVPLFPLWLFPPTSDQPVIRGVGMMDMS